MIIPFILAGISASVILFLSGYKLGKKHTDDYWTKDRKWAELDNATGYPIWAALDREWKYTEELNRPFTDDK
jgi:hypothetical protein